MPENLIQVPDPSQISQFLADGNTATVPAVTGADINDGDLLSATRTIEVGNGYKFEITLPSGRVLESAPVGSDYPKRDAIMQWLGAVRESIVEDSAAAGRAARDAHMAEARARDLAEPASVGRPTQSGQSMGAAVPTDPVEYAKYQLREALQRLSGLQSAESDVAKWQKVVSSLTGEGLPRKRKKRRKKKNANPT
jgi:hypothetical protein